MGYHGEERLERWRDVERGKRWACWEADERGDIMMQVPEISDFHLRLAGPERTHWHTKPMHRPAVQSPCATWQMLALFSACLQHWHFSISWANGHTYTHTNMHTHILACWQRGRPHNSTTNTLEAYFLEEKAISWGYKQQRQWSKWAAANKRTNKFPENHPNKAHTHRERFCVSVCVNSVQFSSIVTSTGFIL